MKRMIGFGVATAALLLSACQTPESRADAKPDPRQGEQVSQICFTSQIRNWRELDRRSVIVERGLKDEYKLELAGTCEPQDAFTSIGFVSRVGGGSCLSTGDRLVTDARYNDGSCLISRIYKWNEDAGKPEAEEAS